MIDFGRSSSVPVDKPSPLMATFGLVEDDPVLQDR